MVTILITEIYDDHNIIIDIVFIISSVISAVVGTVILMTIYIFVNNVRDSFY